MNRDRFEKQKDFILEIDKEKNIYRQTHLSGHGRNENDAEHAWHMAIMVYLLQEYANEPINVGKTMLMCLIHDIVEIDYDEEAKKTQQLREEQAKERIFSLLPEDQKASLTELFDEFEANESPESRFAHAIDNLQPFLLNDSNDGGDWVEHGVGISQILKRQTKTRDGSEVLCDYIMERLEDNIKKGSIREDRRS